MANPTPLGSGLHVDAVSGVGVTTALQARLVQAGSYSRNGTVGTVVARPGVIYAGKTNLLSRTSTGPSPMTIQVEPLHFVGVKAGVEGAYAGVVPALTLVDVSAAPGSNSRIDVVYVAQEDFNAGVSPDSQSRISVGVVAGTPAAVPTEPTLVGAAPVGAVKIGTITVPSGAVNTNGCTVNTACQWTAPLGTPIYCGDLTARNTLTPYTGLQVYRADLGYTERYNGTAWQGGGVVENHQTGSYTFTASYADVPNMSVQLPAGRWFIVAKGNTDCSTGTARICDVKLTDGADKDNVSIMAGTNHKIPYTLTTYAVYSSTTTIKLQARTSAIDGTQLLGNGRITAHALIGS